MQQASGFPAASTDVIRLCIDVIKCTISSSIYIGHCVLVSCAGLFDVHHLSHQQCLLTNVDTRAHLPPPSPPTITHIHTYIHTHAHTHSLSNTHTHIHPTTAHIHTHTYTHTQTQTHTQTHTPTHTHPHTHTCMLAGLEIAVSTLTTLSKGAPLPTAPEHKRSNSSSKPQVTEWFQALVL